jgi:hypothetical protein
MLMHMKLSSATELSPEVDMLILSQSTMFFNSECCPQ